MKTARELMLERAKVHFNQDAHLARKGLNPASILELRTAVANGEVDPGPIVDHSDDPPVEDNRDKRDPTMLGKEFLARHNGFADLEPKHGGSNT